ncbi:MAG: AAA family ATPase [Desulfurococcales archaeon]|nr:AAA family ATPase [Desulfurococcales archaeon]
MLEVNIIRDMRVFEDSYIPPTLPVRQDIADMLAMRFYRRIMRGASSADLTLVYGNLGRVGIGKTTIVRYAARKAVEVARRKGYNTDYVYVNLFDGPTIHEVINRILTQLNPKIAWRGVSLSDKIQALADTLYMNNMRLIVILDEIQTLFKRPGSDADKLYTLIRLHELAPHRVESGVGADYVLIASNEMILSYLRERLPMIESQISYILRLDPYRSAELYKILLQRAELGLYPGTWDDSLLATIADFYGIDSPVAKRPEGSARMAIVALRTAAEIAESEGQHRITGRHVSMALGMATPASLDRRILENLSKHELLLLLAIAQLTMEKDDFSTTGEVRKLYEELAKEHGEKPRGHSQFNEYIKKLSALDLIIARPSSKGVRGRTTLMRIAPEIPADLLRSEIMLILEGARG